MMNWFVWGVGTLSVVSVIGGVLNLVRLTRKIALRERKLAHPISLDGHPAC